MTQRAQTVQPRRGAGARAGEADRETLSVREAAEHLGVSERRVRALIAEGRLAAQKLGGRWAVDRRGIGRRVQARPAAVRPLSARSAAVLERRLQALLEQDEGVAWREGVSAVEAHRTERRLRRLLEAEQPAPLLRAWVAHQFAPVDIFWAPLEVLDRADLPLSGTSLPEAGLARAGTVEVQWSDPIPVQWRREPDGEHPVRMEVHRRARLAGRATALMNLACHAGPREDAALARLLREWG